MRVAAVRNPLDGCDAGGTRRGGRIGLVLAVRVRPRDDRRDLPHEAALRDGRQAGSVWAPGGQLVTRSRAAPKAVTGTGRPRKLSGGARPSGNYRETAVAFLRQVGVSAALAGSVSSGREEPGAAVTALLAVLVNRKHLAVRSAGGADWLLVRSQGHAGQVMPLTGRVVPRSRSRIANRWYCRLTGSGSL
jgi:hypothetical protein